MQTQSIDVIKLYAESNTKKWNAWLKKCHAERNIDELQKTRVGLQVGMTNAQKKGLVDEKLAVTFTRWISSIDKTMLRIIKDKKMGLIEKRAMYNELEKYILKESF